MPRLVALYKNKSKIGMGQVTTASALVVAGMLASELVEEGGDSTVLVAWASKVVREATPREASRHFGGLIRLVQGRAADASDRGTCETTTLYERLGIVHAFVHCLIKRHTYRMQGIRGRIVHFPSHRRSS